MKRTQVVALIAGMALGLSGMALGVTLARKEGRDAARRFLDQYGDLGQKGSQAALTIASQARKVGGQVAKTAAEQYTTQMPRAREALSGIVAQAPQAAEALTAAFARGTASLNGKVESSND